MAAENHGIDLVQLVALLGAGVVAVPLFRRLGLGSVLAYFAAGIIIGPFGLRLISDPQTILHTAELGVIMLLFVIGLEMQPSRLWNLRREIFGLGVAQVITCGFLLTCVAMLAGLSLPVSFIAAMGFVLSSTAVVMQMLAERGDTSTAQGQKAVSILLLEDLAIVPLLAIVAVIGPTAVDDGEPRWAAIAIAIASVAGLVVAGRWLLNPMFRILAQSQAREVMTAAALLVVLGAALLMEIGGLSMAMGAFLAGVLLSESSFRHQLEADIEPFRGILLGIFFIAIGMSLDLAVVARDWLMIAAAVTGFTLVKSIGIFLIARLFGSSWRDALDRVTLFAQGGEFAFVLYAAALAAGIFSPHLNAIFTATVIVSMALTPVIAILVRRAMPSPATTKSMDGIEPVNQQSGDILMIGFGRFSHIACQGLLARGFNLTIIENDVEMIQAASTFGFKIYYGEGTRLDILHASGAATARAIIVCVDNTNGAATQIARMVRREFPLARLYVRAHDRGHALDLIQAGVDYQIRETFESALALSGAVLRDLDVPEDEVTQVLADVRRRDEERFELQLATSDVNAGNNLILGNAPKPTPLTPPKQQGQVIGAVPAAVSTTPKG